MRFQQNIYFCRLHSAKYSFAQLERVLQKPNLFDVQMQEKNRGHTITLKWVYMLN